jgi:hypothetical protein
VADFKCFLRSQVIDTPCRSSNTKPGYVGLIQDLARFILKYEKLATRNECKGHHVWAPVGQPVFCRPSRQGHLTTRFWVAGTKSDVSNEPFTEYLGREDLRIDWRAVEVGVEKISLCRADGFGVGRRWEEWAKAKKCLEEHSPSLPSTGTANCPCG